MSKMHNPAHPGKILASYVDGHTVGEVAKHLGVTRPALSRVLNGRAAISAEMALRIAKTFNTDPGQWVRMQANYDLWHARKKKINAHPLKVMLFNAEGEAIAHAKSLSPSQANRDHATPRRQLAARSNRTITARATR